MRLPRFIRTRQTKILLFGIFLSLSFVFIKIWMTLGMYADSQALATGDSTLFYNFIGWAFALAAVTFIISGPNSPRNQLSSSNPALLFLFGGFLMLMNIPVPQFHSIPYAGASMALYETFDITVGTGAVGLFLFLSGFQVIIMSAVKAKITNTIAGSPNIPVEHNPYRWFSFLLKNEEG